MLIHYKYRFNPPSPTEVNRLRASARFPLRQIKRSYNIWIRALCILIVITFLAESVAWAYPADDISRHNLSVQPIFGILADTVGRQYLGRIETEMALIIGSALKEFGETNHNECSHLDINSALDSQSKDRRFKKLLELTEDPKKPQDDPLIIKLRTTRRKKCEFVVTFRGKSVDELMEPGKVSIERVEGPGSNSQGPKKSVIARRPKADEAIPEAKKQKASIDAGIASLPPDSESTTSARKDAPPDSKGPQEARKRLPSTAQEIPLPSTLELLGKIPFTKKEIIDEEQVETLARSFSNGMFWGGQARQIDDIPLPAGLDLGHCTEFSSGRIRITCFIPLRKIKSEISYVFSISSNIFGEDAVIGHGLLIDDRKTGKLFFRFSIHPRETILKEDGEPVAHMVPLRRKGYGKEAMALLMYICESQKLFNTNFNELQFRFYPNDY